MDRFVYLINNGDPLTSAPETQVPPTGLAKLVAAFTRGKYGYYEPEFTTRSFGILLGCHVLCANRKTVHPVK